MVGTTPLDVHTRIPNGLPHPYPPTQELCVPVPGRPVFGAVRGEAWDEM